jgi:anti-sigma regulatory factor (Ser/Thr protein kinase)
LTLANDLSAVGQASEWLRTLGAEAGVAADDIYRIDLCAAELLTNIVSYGYDDQRAHEIELALTVHYSEVALEIADDGRPFDPVAHPSARPATSLAEARWGGWGLRLVRQFADECRYASRRGTCRACAARRRAGAGTRARARGLERRATAAVVSIAPVGGTSRWTRSGPDAALGFISGSRSSAGSRTRSSRNGRCG